VTQDREILRRRQNTCEQPAILQAQEPERPSEAFRDQHPAGALAGQELSKQGGEFHGKHGATPGQVFGRNLNAQAAARNKKSRRAG